MSGFSGVISFNNNPLLRFDKSLIKNSLTQRGYGFKEIGQSNFYLNNVRNGGQLSKQNLISIDNYVINFDGRKGAARVACDVANHPKCARGARGRGWHKNRS